MGHYHPYMAFFGGPLADQVRPNDKGYLPDRYAVSLPEPISTSVFNDGDNAYADTAFRSRIFTYIRSSFCVNPETAAYFPGLECRGLAEGKCCWGGTCHCAQNCSCNCGRCVC